MVIGGCGFGMTMRTLANLKSMTEEFSAGGIILKQENGKTYVLLVEYPDDHTYGFPKGHIEKGETIEQAARREIAEEVGLMNIELKENLGSYQRESRDPETGAEALKTIILFLVQVNAYDHAKETHELYAWLPVEKAISRFKYKEDADFFKKHVLKK